MLDIDPQGRLSWGERDIRIVTKLTGDKTAVACRMPYNPGALKWLAKRLAQTPAVNAALQHERKVRLTHIDRLSHADVEPMYSEDEKLFPHVRVAMRALQLMRTPYALLADEVGVGKTPLAIRQAERLPILKHLPILVITTNTAKLQWRKAFKKFGQMRLPCHIVQGRVTEQMQIIREAPGMSVVIGHWESLVHAGDAYRARAWSTIIADEAQWAYNREAKRTQTLHALAATQRYALTAHPYSKGPDELWSILHFLDPVSYSSFWRFFDMHVDYDPKPFGGFDINGPKRAKLLEWEIAPFTIRRTRREVRETLPRITRVSRVVELSPRGLKEFQQLKKAFFAELGTETGTKKIPILNALARTTRLRQYLVDPGLLGSTEPPVKHAAVLDIISEVQKPIVIFSAFRQALLRLQDVLRKAALTVGMISGAETTAERELARSRFVKGKLDAILVVVSAGREAINLGGYGYALHLDLPWTPKDLEQTEGRVDRPHEETGLSIPTTAFRIVVANSYEERMEDRLEDRHGQFSRVFSINDLKGLFE